MNRGTESWVRYRRPNEVVAQSPAAWVVTIRSPGEDDEVAAVFANRDDAERYAAWWNREEIHRYGRESGAAARAEETDFYPAGAWRPPVRLRVTATPPSGLSLDGS